MHYRLACLMILLAAALPAAPLRVGVSVLPLEPVVLAIGGDAVEVQSLQREGDSCSVFEPRPSAITWLAGSRIFFRTGVGYETVILEKIGRQYPELEVVDLRDAVQLLYYEGGAHHHDHAHEGCNACAGHADASGEADPHIWLDPVRLAAIGDLIAERLAAALPEDAPAIRARAADFRTRAMAVDQRLREQLAPHAGAAFYIYHPALAYFADRYGLRQIAIAGPVQGPTARELHRLIGEARAAGVRSIFVQPQESRRHAEIVAAAIGAQLVEIDPMAPDWEANLLRIGAALAAALAQS